MDLLALLSGKNVITKRRAQDIARESQESGKSVEDLLLKAGVAKEEVLRAKSEHFGLPTKDVEGEVTTEALKYIPEESAKHYGFVPLGVEDGVLEVGIVDPDNIEARDALNFISTKINMPFKASVISEHDFARILEKYKGLSGEVNKALTELETELSVDDNGLVRVGAETTDASTIAPGTTIIEDAPVTKIVATVLRYAAEGQASDIHIEPTADMVRVRFRVDGTLYTSLRLPLQVHPAVVARIKVLSNMRLDEKRKPQDGRFSAHLEGRRIDFRVSTFPSFFGEKVVMRILDTEKGVKALDSMGLSTRNLQLIRSAITRPYGMILISGPTGSGKSTTLYSMMNEVDREQHNVLSLEDPVEYNIPGMNQSQIHPEIGYTFANGLRTTLRQDPDIIMVGEIRDKETAQLAVQAALTGHLVFSTVHTNNAVGVIPRLIDMGVDPYLIAPTLILAIAQRLVRTLCPGGGKKIPVEGSRKIMLDKQFADLPAEFRKDIPPFTQLFEIEATPECPNGTRGRMAVFEVLEMSKDIEHALLKTPISEEEIEQAARKRGMLSMKEDALIKSMQGLIPFEEVNTVGVIDIDE